MLTILSTRGNINDCLRQGETPGFPSASRGGGLLLESLVDKGLVMKHEKSRGSWKQTSATPSPKHLCDTFP